MELSRQPRTTPLALAARSLTALLAAGAMAVGVVVATPSARAATPVPTSAVTNLAHLDSLLDTVPLRAGAAGHSTYARAAQPTSTALWVYADRAADGSYRRTGGGALDPATGHYAQGAFDADDIARAIVVYLQDWRAHGDGTGAASRERAVGLLRTLTYLQTSSGPHAGDVVLWMQTDGTLTPSPTPRDTPDPSDATDSFWLARTLWALGEAKVAFDGDRATERAHPGFAAFLDARYQLSLAALRRQSLARFGQWRQAGSARVPAWLVSDSTGASAEAALGLAAVAAADPRDAATRTALREEAEGIAAMATGDAQHWPFGGFLSSADPALATGADSTLNAWAGQAPAALARAAAVLHRPGWGRTATRAVTQAAAQLLAAGGPDNALTPTPSDRTQIAYGADSVVASALAVADTTGSASASTVAAAAAAWFFGANPAGQPAYDPATGACVDGISADGVVNRGCGAESAIHTELTMQALDAHPAVRDLARSLTSRAQVTGLVSAEAEAGATTGAAGVLRPAPTAGSPAWSGGAYLQAGAGSTLTLQLPAAVAAGPFAVLPVLGRDPGGAGAVAWTASGPRGVTALGQVPAGDASRSTGGTSRRPLTLPALAPSGTTSLTAAAHGGTARIDAVLLVPLVAHLALRGARSLDLYASAAIAPVRQRVTASAPATVTSDDADGRPVVVCRLAAGGSADVVVPPGGTLTVVTE